MEVIKPESIKSILKARPPQMHKGQAGRVLIIAGQIGMAGAAVLAARGALYSGAGLVKVSAPERIFDIIQISVPEAMCISRRNMELEEYDAVAIGPGMGVSEENYKLIEDVLLRYRGPAAVDADGLNCLCAYAGASPGKSGIIPDIIGKRRGATVLTPHPGEADRLLRALGERGYRELGRRRSADRLAEVTGAIVLLKGSETLIAAANGRAYGADPGRTKTDVYMNTTGNAGMATGGSGDVLTGMIASLLAQGRGFMCASPMEATLAAAYLHGSAGDIAAEKMGQYGMTSADIADAVPAALKKVTGI